MYCNDYEDPPNGIPVKNLLYFRMLLCIILPFIPKPTFQTVSKCTPCTAASAQSFPRLLYMLKLPEGYMFHGKVLVDC